jgi:hypothetical protein
MDVTVCSLTGEALVVHTPATRTLNDVRRAVGAALKQHAAHIQLLSDAELCPFSEHLPAPDDLVYCVSRQFRTLHEARQAATLLSVPAYTVDPVRGFVTKNCSPLVSIDVELTPAQLEHDVPCFPEGFSVLSRVVSLVPGTLHLTDPAAINGLHHKGPVVGATGAHDLGIVMSPHNTLTLRLKKPLAVPATAMLVFEVFALPADEMPQWFTVQNMRFRLPEDAPARRWIYSPRYKGGMMTRIDNYHNWVFPDSSGQCDSVAFLPPQMDARVAILCLHALSSMDETFPADREHFTITNGVFCSNRRAPTIVVDFVKSHQCDCVLEARSDAPFTVAVHHGGRTTSYNAVQFPNDPATYSSWHCKDAALLDGVVSYMKLPWVVRFSQGVPTVNEHTSLTVSTHSTVRLLVELYNSGPRVGLKSAHLFPCV